MSGKFRIAVTYGTRPELIKLFPVVRALAAHPDEVETIAVCTGQHRGLLAELHADLKFRPAIDLDVMKEGQSLAGLTAAILQELEPVLQRLTPDMLLVQGDTSSVLSAALAAFYQRIPVAHLEAGVRTHHRASPYPEEMNRVLAAQLADWHYAPTERARGNLLAEGIAAGRIVVTGNTAIDALLHVLDDGEYLLPEALAPIMAWAGETILITAHRRESWGASIMNIARAAADLLRDRPQLQIIWPVHPNPVVAAPVRSILGCVDRARLLPPLSYHAFARCMQKAALILSDSGGVQEEAPSVRKRVLVLRDVTDRPEAVEAGWAEVVGTESGSIVARASALMQEGGSLPPANPYGDGKAAERAVGHLLSLAAAR